MSLDAELAQERAEELLDSAANWVEQALDVFGPTVAREGRHVLDGLRQLKSEPSTAEAQAMGIVDRYRGHGLEGKALRRAVERHMRILEAADPAVAAALAECPLAPPRAQVSP
jgi:hypothetical protein